ncbi:MAG: hypothetical protein SVV03_02540 [Candidatus Nanohaloarchaea archaeon]|nr:hypothetical protein [Candidatus Nanohaloarchaea archaeon]
MNEARLKLIQAVENADKNLTEEEKSALADDLLPRLKRWKQ